MKSAELQNEQLRQDLEQKDTKIVKLEETVNELKAMMTMMIERSTP